MTGCRSKDFNRPPPFFAPPILFALHLQLTHTETFCARLVSWRSTHDGVTPFGDHFVRDLMYVIAVALELSTVRRPVVQPVSTQPRPTARRIARYFCVSASKQARVRWPAIRSETPGLKNKEIFSKKPTGTFCGAYQFKQKKSTLQTAADAFTHKALLTNRCAILVTACT